MVMAREMWERTVSQTGSASGSPNEEVGVVGVEQESERKVYTRSASTQEASITIYIQIDVMELHSETFRRGSL